MVDRQPLELQNYFQSLDHVVQVIVIQTGNVDATCIGQTGHVNKVCETLSR